MRQPQRRQPRQLCAGFEVNVTYVTDGIVAVFGIFSLIVRSVNAEKYEKHSYTSYGRAIKLVTFTVVCDTSFIVP